jgi:hypothetical protein
LPAGCGWLEGGRNSLLELTQEATLMSVPIQAIEGQSNRMVKMALAGRFKGVWMMILARFLPILAGIVPLTPDCLPGV